MFQRLFHIATYNRKHVYCGTGGISSRITISNRERKVSAWPKRHDGAGHTNLSRATGRSSTARHLSTAEIGFVCQGLKASLVTCLYGFIKQTASHNTTWSRGLLGRDESAHAGRMYNAIQIESIIAKGNAAKIIVLFRLRCFRNHCKPKS